MAEQDSAREPVETGRPTPPSKAVPRGDSLTYTDSPCQAAQATTCVLPDEEGLGAMLETESRGPRSRLDVPPSPWAGGQGASQPPAPTDPGVTVSRHRALLTSRSERTNPSPMGEQAGFSLEEPGPPPLEPLVGPQPPVLLPSPAPQVEADAPEEGIHLRPVVPAVVVHPPGDDGVQPSRQVVQRQVGAPVDPQSAEPVACGLERLG